MTTFINKDNGTVTLPQDEYDKLLQYKQLCKEFQEVLTGGDSE